MKERAVVKQPFGLAIDVIGALIKGILLYCLVLTWNYWSSLSGYGTLQPVLCMLVIVAVLGLSLLFGAQKGTWMVPAGVAAVSAVLGGLFLAGTNRIAFFGILFVMAVVEVYRRHRYPSWEKRAEIRRNKLHMHVIFYGVALCVIPLLAFSGVNVVYTQAMSRGYETCMHYMSLLFIVYLVLVVLLEYVYKQYYYFRTKAEINLGVYAKLKRMNWIIGILVAVVFGSILLFLRETLVLGFRSLLGWILTTFVKGAAWISGSLFSKLMLLFAGRSREVSERPFEEVIPNIQTSNMPDHVGYVIGIFVVAGTFIVVIWRLLKAYKERGATYTSEDETSVYIKEDKGVAVSRYVARAREKVDFPEDERGRIRKVYYKVMNKKIQKGAVREASSKTARELAKIYAAAENQGKMEVLTLIYEKARYSDEECGEEDVRRMKKMVE